MKIIDHVIGFHREVPSKADLTLEIIKMRRNSKPQLHYYQQKTVDEITKSANIMLERYRQKVNAAMGVPSSILNSVGIPKPPTNLPDPNAKSKQTINGVDVTGITWTGTCSTNGSSSWSISSDGNWGQTMSPVPLEVTITQPETPDDAYDRAMKGIFG